MNIYLELSNSKEKWALSNSLHWRSHNKKIFNPIIPFFQNKILEINTVGSPSAIVFRNNQQSFFDVKTWMRLDVDFYYFLFKKYGKPKYLGNVYVVNELHENQFSSLMIQKSSSTKLKLKEELDYICKKYNYKRLSFLNLIFLKIIIKIERTLISFFYHFLKKYFGAISQILYKYIYSKFY